MNWVFSADQAYEAGSSVIGGKAFALARRARDGFDVPPFFVLTPDAFRSDVDLEEVEKILAARTALLPGRRFAVRSSARSEDGASDSHAGQFRTVLDVEPAGIVAAAQEVVVSGAAGSVADYRAARGIEGVDLPAVVVQSMIPARAAGVAFAADPVTGRRDRVTISAIAGLGEALVSGAENGETWVLSVPSLEALVRPSSATALGQDDARRVAELCLRVSRAAKAPQDIEWAFEPGRPEPWLLQSRPITTALLPEGPSETRLLVLDNSNIVESYPGVVSPLTFSFAAQAYARVYRTFLGMVGVNPGTIDGHRSSLANMLSLVDGRMYYNLGNWYRLLSLLPFFSRNQRYMESMMGVSAPLPDETINEVRSRAGARDTARMIVRLTLRAFRLGKIRDAFFDRVEASVPPRAVWASLSKLPLSGLALEYRRIEAALLDRWDAPIVNDFLCMMAFGASRNLLGRWAGEAGVALHNDVMIGQGDIISAEPARLIREMGEIARERSGLLDLLSQGDAEAVMANDALGGPMKAYLQKFGDRRIGELKLEQPTLEEDPSSLFRAVLAAASKTRAKTEVADPTKRLEALFAGKPVRLALMGRLLAYAKARVRDRENLRFERTRIFGYARRVFLAMGAALVAIGELDADDDVFLLTVEEILGVAEGAAVSRDLKRLVALRRDEREANAALPDPPERVLLRGSVIDRASRLTPTAPAALDDTALERRGTACGGGLVVGKARVVRDPANEQVSPGEILVARHTDPGWISHFVNAAAVVAERGSVLSHSAIVSRELGIPCVVAVPGACSWIRTGETIAVDGALGVVRKVP